MAYSREKLIISADDFGISQLANDHILALVEAGKLNRVSVMAHGKFTPEEIARLKKTGIKLDIHLDSASEIATDRKLRAGIFLRGIKFILAYLSDSGNHSAKSDWQNQIQKFNILFGQNPDGLNSHQHIHFFPAYFKIITQLAQKNSIVFIRFGAEKILGSNNLICCILSCLRKINHKNFIVSKLESSDYMVSLDWLGNLPKFLDTLPEGITEIVCHPERPEELEIIKKYF
ncbi:MAG: ChbG/HpnK family deacetylase [Candidatus Moranbacteria bacterium]|nr:ChbG/HpnK family deacetylase [Candidatus Moranbacteria bacterium]